MMSFTAYPPSAIVGLSIVVSFVLFYKLSFNIPRYVAFYGFFILVELFSKFVVNDADFTRGESYIFVSWAYLVCFFLFILIENRTFSQKFIGLSEEIFKWVLMTGALVSIIQYFSPGFLSVKSVDELFVDDQFLYKNRIPSIFSWTGDNKGAGFTVPIMLGLILNNSRRSLKVNFYSYILPALIIVFLTQARFGMINLLIVLFFYARKTWSAKIALGVVFSIIVLTVLVSLLDFNIDYLVTERLQGDTSARTFIYDYFLQIFPEKPWWGTGGFVDKSFFKFEGIGNKFHNGYIAIAYYYGIIGFTLYFLFVYSLFRKILNVSKKTQFQGAFVGMLCFFWTNFTVDLNIFLETSLVFLLVYNRHYQNLYAQVVAANKTISLRESFEATGEHHEYIDNHPGKGRL